MSAQTAEALRDEPAGERTSVTAAEIIRNFGHWQQKALEAPLAITHHGRSRVMLIGVDAYERLIANRPKTIGGDPIELLQFIDNATEGFLAHDADLRLTYMNKVAEDYCGHHRGQMLGRIASGQHAGAPDNYFVSMWRQVLKTGEPVSFEVESRLFPGRRVSARAFPYKGGVGTLFLNITERDRLRSKAEQAKALSAAVSEGGVVATVMLDARGRLRSADSAFEKLLGFTAGDMKDVRLAACVVPKDRRRVEQFVEELWTNVKSGVVSCNVIVKNGTEKSFKIAVVPLMRDDVPTAMLLVLTEAPPA